LTPPRHNTWTAHHMKGARELRAGENGMHCLAWPWRLCRHAVGANAASGSCCYSNYSTLYLEVFIALSGAPVLDSTLEHCASQLSSRFVRCRITREHSTADTHPGGQIPAHTRSHPSQRSPLIQGETDQSSLAPSTEGTAPSAGSRSGLVADILCQWERCGSGLMECLHPTTARDNLGAVWQLQPSRGRDGAGEARHSRCSPFQCRCSAGYKDEALPPEKGGCRFSKLVVTRSHKPFLPSDPISRLHRRPLAQKHIPL